MSYLKDELSGFIPEEISGEIIKDVANKREEGSGHDFRRRSLLGG